MSGHLPADADSIGRGGWVVGSFFPESGQDGVRHTEQLEVKYWGYPKGEQTHHGTKVSETIEWSMILTGTVLARVGDEELKLGAGDYVLIHPGTPNNLVSEVLESVSAITVKAPSNPTAKHQLTES